MTVALAGRAPATFEIKSANLPLVSLLLKSADLAALGTEMQARFGDIPDFFDNDPLVIDLSPLKAQQPDAALDFAALLDLLRVYRVIPVAVRGGTEAQLEAALKAGLAPAGDLMDARVEASARGRGPSDNAQDRQAQPERGGGRPQPQAVRPAPVDGPARQAAPDVHVPSTALVIDKPLRSGQQVYARGRDLVVLSMVNPGAEVIADGHIHVYAPLRGKAIAGARGNADARILSLCLEPELISIAGVYRTSEVPLPDEIRSQPTQVRLVGGAEGKLVMDRLHT